MWLVSNCADCVQKIPRVISPLPFHLQHFSKYYFPVANLDPCILTVGLSSHTGVNSVMPAITSWKLHLSILPRRPETIFLLFLLSNCPWIFYMCGEDINCTGLYSFHHHPFQETRHSVKVSLFLTKYRAKLGSNRCPTQCKTLADGFRFRTFWPLGFLSRLTKLSHWQRPPESSINKWADWHKNSDRTVWRQ